MGANYDMSKMEPVMSGQNNMIFPFLHVGICRSSYIHKHPALIARQKGQKAWNYILILVGLY